MKNTKFALKLGGITIAITAIVMGVTANYNSSLDKAATLSAINPAHQKQAKLDMTQTAKYVVAAAFHKQKISSRVLGSSTVVQDPELNSEVISEISNPAIVRIFTHITGNISIPDFDIDLNTFDLVKKPNIYSEPVDTAYTGSGFFANDKGYILTNAHVIDKDNAKDEFIASVAEYYASHIIAEVSKLSPAQQAQLEQSLRAKYGAMDDESISEAMGLDMIQKIKDYSDQNVKADLKAKIAVLDPNTKKVPLKTKADKVKLIDSSIPATLVDMYADYTKSHKDAALIKIDQDKTPALSINSDSSIDQGQKIYVLGFPANAQLDSSDLFQSTITEGTIGSVKNLDDAKVYQIDAKISQGSSGGPLLDRYGKVVGMLTYGTDGQAVGDSFGYALPIKSANDLLSKNNVSMDGSNYFSSYVGGLVLADQSLCRKANVQFNSAKEYYSKFNGSDQIDKHISSCNDMIAAGNSLDGKWENFKHQLSNLPIYAWAGLGLILLVIAAVIFYFLRMRKTAPVVASKPIPVI